MGTVTAMSLNRRDFLLLGGLASGIGLAAIAKRGSGKAAAVPSTPETLTTLASANLVKAARTSEPLLRFVAIADTGSGDANQYAVAQAMTRYRQQRPYVLVLMAGDNIYTNGEMQKIGEVFEKPYGALLKQGVKFHACLGNHDIRTENGNLQLQYAGFHMPQRYYTFRQKTVQFFALDTNGNATWNAQIAWLEQELKRSNAPWKVVFGHHPIYSAGVYGSSPALIQTLTPLFKKYQVQLYINGHEHSYERTHPIDDTTYLITGNGGARLRPVGHAKWTAYSDSRYGFSALEVYADRMEVRAIASDNTTFDQGMIPLRSI